MNKKQRNRKLVTQNKRNRIINRRYVSTIKTLSKLFTSLINSKESSNLDGNQNELNPQLLKITKNLYSIIDKAVKKRVLHKNTAARKKSRIGKLYIQTK
jgi:small subunit ribosomal protein S20